MLLYRTFKPEALERHKKGCKEDKPMAKNKGPGYTAQMKAKVNYPKLGKSSQQQQQQQKMDQPQQNIPEPSVSSESPSIIRKETVVISKAKPPPAPAATTATTATTTSTTAAKIRTDQPELIKEPEDA